MLLCDIGNSSYHFKDEDKNYKKSVKDFNPKDMEQKVYFISVNEAVNQLLKSLPNWINLAKYINKEKYYETMGIDRIVAIETVQNGVIVDVGSAITVDVVRDGIFEGGFIYSGINAMKATYANISPALRYDFNFDVNLKELPQNSQDSISYGYLKTLYLEVVSYKLPIILTGGDCKKFKSIFKDAIIDEDLIFKGMKNIIKL